MIRIAGLRVQLSRRALLAGLAGAIVVALAATSIVLVAAHGRRAGTTVVAGARSAGTSPSSTGVTGAAVDSSGASTPTPTPAPTSSGAAAIPWVNKPGTPQSLPAVGSAGRACRAADLDIAAGLAGAFQGLATQELTLRDHASDACFLAGAPQVVLTNAGALSRVNLGQFAAKRLDVASGSSAGIVLGTPATCAGSGKPVVTTSVLLTLPSGDAVTVGGTQIDTECGAATVVEFGAADVLPAATPGPIGSLSVTLTAPQTVARGAVLAYQVTLANQTSVPVALSPCPSYTQVLGTTQQTLVLNCQGAASIAANATATFQMQLTVPASASPGDTKLSWALEVPEGPLAGALITVT